MSIELRNKQVRQYLVKHLIDNKMYGFLSMLFLLNHCLLNTHTGTYSYTIYNNIYLYNRYLQLYNNIPMQLYNRPIRFYIRII